MTTKEHLDKHDRQIAAIRALIQEAKRIGVEARKDLRAIAAMQKRGCSRRAKARLDIK
jgi:hypothetical protein